MTVDAAVDRAYARIRKAAARSSVRLNLADYGEARRTFDWAAARRELAGLPDGEGLNIAHEAVDRHADGPRAGHVALRWLAKTGAARDLTYAELRALTDRFASVRHGLGLGRGERVFVLAGRIPELYVAALGALKAGGAFSPLFSAFGPEPIHARLSLGEGKVLVTTEALYRCEVAALRDRLPRLEHVILVGEGGRRTAVEGILDWHALTANASERFRIPPTGPEDMALLHFTSGTTDRQAQGRDPRPRGRRRG